MTFSLVARCAETGMFGVAISSSSPAVAARCSYTRAGIGAVASQNVTDPSLGPLTLDLMQEGAGADAAVAEVDGHGFGPTPLREQPALASVLPLVLPLEEIERQREEEMRNGDALVHPLKQGNNDNTKKSRRRRR